MTERRRLEDIRAALADHATDLARHLLGEPNARMSSKRELRFGSKGSLAIVIAGAKAGQFYDHQTGEGGDLLTLIERERGGGFCGALDFAQDFCGGDLTRVARRIERKPSPDNAEQRLRKARFLWSLRQPIDKSLPAFNYLRNARSYHWQIPPTLGYLPARDQHQHAIIAAFGIADDTEPGVLRITDGSVLGVHLIKLNADGSDRDRSVPKLTLGHCLGSPIVCGPFHDTGNDLVIAEGVEDALSAHFAMGIGAWAAGGASRMPAPAETVPSFVESITICVDGDEAGRSNSVKLALRLRERGFEVRLTEGVKG